MLSWLLDLLVQTRVGVVERSMRPACNLDVAISPFVRQFSTHCLAFLGLGADTEPFCFPPMCLPAEGHGRSRKLSITLVKQPAAAAGQQQKQYTVWEGLLAGPAGDDAPKSPEKRDQAAKEG